MKILIIQSSFIGDVILSTGLVEKLKEHFPNAQIDFLLRKGNEGLLENNPKIRKTLIWDKKNKWKSWRQLLKEVQAEKYDLLINLQRHFAMGLFTILSKAKKTIGFDKNPFSRFFTVSKPHILSLKGENPHEIERNHSLISDFVSGSAAHPKLYPPAHAYTTIPKGKYICITPASVWFTKTLPPEKWQELIEHIPPEIEIHLLGGKGDWDLCQAIKTAAKHPKVFVQAGKMPLLYSAAWLEKAYMNYVNDSSPLHLCSATNAPVTVFFCSTSPSLGFGPLSDQHFILEVEGLDCKPCGFHGYKKCPKGHFNCSKINLDLL